MRNVSISTSIMLQGPQPHVSCAGHLSKGPNKQIHTRQTHVSRHVLYNHATQRAVHAGHLAVAAVFVGTVAAPLLHHRLAGPLALGGAGARPLPCKLRVAQSTSGPKTGSYSYFVGCPCTLLHASFRKEHHRHIWTNNFALNSTEHLTVKFKIISTL